MLTPMRSGAYLFPGWALPILGGRLRFIWMVFLLMNSCYGDESTLVNLVLAFVSTIFGLDVVSSLPSNTSLTSALVADAVKALIWGVVVPLCVLCGDYLSLIMEDTLTLRAISSVTSINYSTSTSASHDTVYSCTAMNYTW